MLAALIAWPGWTRPLRDPDLWWLLSAGDALRAGTFDWTNHSSFTAPGEPWRLHESLVALAYSGVGLGGVGWVRGGVLSLLAAAVLRQAARSRSGWATVLALTWAGPLLSVALSERAMAWGDALFALTMLLVWPVEHGLVAPARAHPTSGDGEPARYSQALTRLGACLVVGLWASVHGSFVVGVLAIGLVSWRWGLLAAALSLLNPLGPGAWALVMEYGLGRGSTSIVHDYIVEWTPLWPDDLAWSLRSLAVAVGLALALIGPDRKGRLLTVLLALLALWHRRYCDVFAIGALPAVAASLSARLPSRPIGPVLPALALLVAPVAILSPRAAVDPRIYPEAVRAALDPTAPTWTDIELGAWSARQGVPVFWDTRNDCYPSEVLQDGVRVAWQLEGWEGVLERWQVRQVLTRDSSLTEALQDRGALKVAYDSGLTLLRLPTTPATDTLRMDDRGH